MYAHDLIPTLHACRYRYHTLTAEFIISHIFASTLTTLCSSRQTSILVHADVNTTNTPDLAHNSFNKDHLGIVRTAIQNTGSLHKCIGRMLFQRSFVLLIGQCKVSDGISKIVLIDACQCLPKPFITVQEKCWCGADIKLHHQSLHTADLSAHMTLTCNRLKLKPASQHSAQAECIMNRCSVQNPYKPAALTLVSFVSSPMISKNMAS